MRIRWLLTASTTITLAQSRTLFGPRFAHLLMYKRQTARDFPVFDAYTDRRTDMNWVEGAFVRLRAKSKMKMQSARRNRPNLNLTSLQQCAAFGYELSHTICVVTAVGSFFYANTRGFLFFTHFSSNMGRILQNYLQMGRIFCLF